MNYDLFTSTMEEKRAQGIGLLNSYTNESDKLAELMQNSKDSIYKRRMLDPDFKKGEIEITIDKIDNTISAKDNGIGIENVPVCLRPFSSSKKGDDSTVGEIGVGLAYLILSSTNFKIITAYNGCVTKGTVTGANEWLHSDTPDSLEVSVNNVTSYFNNFEGTYVEMEISGHSKIFELNTYQLETLLRTRTAIGDTGILFEEDLFDIEVTLTVVEENSETISRTIPFGYQSPIEKYQKGQIVQLEHFIEKYQSVKVRDIKKQSALKDKCVVSKGEFKSPSGNRIVKYYAVYVPNRSTFHELAVKLKIMPPNMNFTEIKQFEDEYSFLMASNGIFSSVKGMPTGISLNPPKAGNDGYWHNLHIILEDPSLKFDIGRKHVNQAYSRFLIKCTREIFTKFMSNGIPTYCSGNIPVDNGFSKAETMKQIDALPDLKSSVSQFVKTPAYQEAAVSAMFFELLGKGYFSNYDILAVGYKQTYDLYAYEKTFEKFVAIEFKSKLSNILKDFGESKGAEQFDCIVCWDVDNVDEKELQKRDITLLSKDEGEHFSDDLFPLATHQMIFVNNIKPIYVIDLKRVLEFYEEHSPLEHVLA